MRVAVASGLVVGWLLGAATEAFAQTDGFLAVGAGVVARATTGAGAGDTHDPTLIIRLGRGRQGWGLRYGFNWYSTELERSLAGENRPFGRLRVRPLLLGYGYETRYRRTRVSFNLKGGYAFSSFSMQPRFSETYRSVLNTSSVRADAANTLVLKPEVTAWVDLSRKIGLNISTGYLVARPELRLTSGAGVERRRVQADVFMFSVGAVYSIF